MPTLQQPIITRYLDPEAVPFSVDVAYKLLKVKKPSPHFDALKKMVAECADDYRSYLAARYRYRVCAVRGGESEASRVYLDGAFSVEGPGIYRLLCEARYAAFFVLTIGDRLEAEVEALGHEDFMQPYVLDGVASTYVQGLLEMVHHDIEAVAEAAGCVLTHRFAPGYHNWALSQQQPLFDLLQAHEIGMKLSASCFMIPQKSLSGVYGFKNCLGTP